MKKLLIATTALVATAGMASADITITGHAAAGIYSGLDATAAVKGLVPTTNTAVVASTLSTTTGALTAGKLTAAVMPATADYSTDQEKKGFQEAVAEAREDLAQAKAHASSTLKTVADAELALAAAEADLALALGSAASASGDGVYSSAGVDFTMTGATDNGISFSATVNIDAGTEVDTADMELDGKDGGTAGLGAVSMTGAFGTLTFDKNGIDNLYSDATNHDVSYATTVGAVGLTVAYDATKDATKATSAQATYSASGMAFTLTGSEAPGGTSTTLAVSYALNDTVTITADTDSAAGGASVQTVGASTTLNGVSVSVESANNSTWDVDLGYTAGGFALTYGVDETDAWTATATAALGGGATFSAGVDSADATYAGVSFAF